MLFQSGLGIFICEDALSIVYLKNSFKGAKLSARAFYALDSEKSQEERIRLSAELTNDFIQSNKVSSPDVFLGLSRELVIMRQVEFPLAVKENLRSTLAYKIENYVPMKLEDIYFDYQVIDEDKQNNKLKILLIVVKKEILDQHLKIKDRLDMGLTGVGVASTAYVNFLSYHPAAAQDANYIFVHEQKKNVHFGVVINKNLHYARSAVPVEADGAEKFLARELKPVEDLIKDMQKPVRLFYFSNQDESSILPLLRARETFQVETPDLALADISNPALMPAAGLALRGVKKVPMEINLLPVALRKRPSRTVFYMLSVLIGLFAISGMMWGGSRIMHQRLILNNLNAETERLMDEIKNIDRMREDAKRLEARLDYLNNLWRGRVPLLEVLKEVTERLPETAWLQDFSYDEKGVQLYGYAESASELIPLLENSPLFNDVVFLSTITKGKDGKERFRIGFKITS